MRACVSRLSLANGISTPIRRICPDCCARKASGLAADTAEKRDEVPSPHGAWPPCRGPYSSTSLGEGGRCASQKHQPVHVADGSKPEVTIGVDYVRSPNKADVRLASRHVRSGRQLQTLRLARLPRLHRRARITPAAQPFLGPLSFSQRAPSDGALSVS